MEKGERNREGEAWLKRGRKRDGRREGDLEKERDLETERAR